MRPRTEAVSEQDLHVQGYLAHKNPPPLLGPYSRTIPRVLWWSNGGGAVSYEQGTPVEIEVMCALHVSWEREKCVYFGLTPTWL